MKQTLQSMMVVRFIWPAIASSMLERFGLLESLAEVGKDGEVNKVRLCYYG